MTAARRRLLLAVGLAMALLASGPPLPGRGTDRPVASPLPAATLFSPAELLLSRVYPNAARDDEFVEVANPGSAPASIDGWSLTDGEDAATFPAGATVPAGGRIVATRNGTSYEEDLLEPADFTWERGSATRLGGGVLRLADAGDEVLLLDPAGAVVDAYAYGASGYAGRGWTGPPARAPGRGEVAVRGGGGALLDRDAREDWDGLRAFRLGQSSFRPAPVPVDGPAVAIVSPDDGVLPIVSFLGSASTSVHVAVYTLTSEPIASVLAARARAGVRVRILLESAPVGGLEEAESRAVAALLAAGADVRWLDGSDDAVKRYRYLHAKYAIVDGEGVLVTSENFGEAGFPSADSRGNRGWSIVVRDPQLAGQLRDVFDEDFDPRRRDTLPAMSGPSAVPLAPVDVPPWSWPGASSVRTAGLVVGPDNALAEDTILGLVDSARQRLWIDAFYIEDTWGETANPFVEAAFDAARRGVDVRILMDRGFPEAGASETGNEGVATRINARARAEGLRLEVRLLDSRGRVDRVHNKGLVVDGRAVLASSINWALGSATENREIGLILEDPGLASVFERAFLADWDGPGPGSVLPSEPAALLGLYAAVAGASALSLRILRQGDKGLKLGRRMESRGLLRAPLRRGRREVRVLPPELVAEPGPRARGGDGDRGGGEEARGAVRGPEGD